MNLEYTTRGPSICGQSTETYEKPKNKKQNGSTWDKLIYIT